MKLENQCSKCANRIKKYCGLCQRNFCATCLDNFHSPNSLKDHLIIGIRDVEAIEYEQLEDIEKVFRKIFELVTFKHFLNSVIMRLNHFLRIMQPDLFPTTEVIDL